jgi:hypothetical protein
MEIQGEPEAIDRVIQAIKAGRYVQIEGMKGKDIPLLDDERSFRTEY